LLRDLLVDRVVKPGFNNRVYAIVRLVPKGKVTTYGRVATLLGSPRVARHVGWALSALPDTDSDVPWHRVINAQRRISFKGDSFRAQEQKVRLEDEGVRFDANERIDFNTFLWRPDTTVVNG